MRLVVWLLVLILCAVTAYASCTTHTIVTDRKVLVCTTCCVGNHCTTNCY